MKFFAVLLTLFLATVVLGDEMQCSLPVPNVPTDWIDMSSSCVHAVKLQIQKEVDASFTYLAMASYFARDTVNRPGFAHFFFKSAKEEREHGITLIEYLSMRGKLTDTVTELITIPTLEKQEWKDGAHALHEALKLEADVTKSIRETISKCENGKPNDYHLVDYLTGVYLEEQYKAERDLAGKLATLRKMLKNRGYLGEFLFDKKLLD